MIKTIATLSQPITKPMVYPVPVVAGTGLPRLFFHYVLDGTTDDQESVLWATTTNPNLWFDCPFPLAKMTSGQDVVVIQPQNTQGLQDPVCRLEVGYE